MMGYFGQEELTREAIDADGWFHTGDLGRIDSDGFLFVTGRLKSLIVLPSGKKVQPEEVEAVLAASPHAKEVCVLGRAALAGEEVLAVAVPSDSLRREVGEDSGRIRAALDEDFAERLKGLAPFKRPARIEVVDRDLPKTTTGKVRRSEVLRILDAEKSPR
jgi:long-chain acyl-CoA synthetase